jgi:hypothetical protein
MTTNAQFWAEVIETTILQFGIFTLEDMSNVGAEKFLPLGLFFLIFGLGACFGFETGYAMNFARDFGPRLMSYMVGYGLKVWTARHYYFWVPIVAPFIGCTFGVSCTTSSYTPARAQSARLGWVRKWFIRPDKAKEIDDKYGVREGDSAVVFLVPRPYRN